jgi:hypothetical protein
MNNKTFVRAVIVLPLIASLTACDKGPKPSPQPAAKVSGTVDEVVRTNDKLAKIFTSDALGENVQYLESITGPAFSTMQGSPGTSSTVNIYKVDGCLVVVGVSDQKIDNLGIENFGPKCSFDIGQYFHQDMDNNGQSAHEVVSAFPTFGELSSELGGVFFADCLSMCGNAADPIVYLQFSGSHADNYNQLLASIALIDDASIDASEVWAKKLDEKYGEAYSGSLDHGKDNLNDVAVAAFKALKPTTIQVGNKLFAD